MGLKEVMSQGLSLQAAVVDIGPYSSLAQAVAAQGGLSVAGAPPGQYPAAIASSGTVDAPVSANTPPRAGGG
jgi:hypothetical protein